MASPADGALAGLVLDGIFEEAQGSLKYILGQVVLKLQRQEEQIAEQGAQIAAQERLIESMKGSKEESKQLAQEAAEAHGREVLGIMKNITDAMGSRIVDINKTMATLVYNIQGFEMKVSEQSDAQKRAEREYEDRMNQQLDKMKQDQAASTAMLLEREKELEASEAKKMAELKANEDALKRELEELRRRQRRTSAKASEAAALAAAAAREGGDHEAGGEVDMSEVNKRVAEIEAKLKHDNEENMERMRQENERARELERERAEAKVAPPPPSPVTEEVAPAAAAAPSAERLPPGLGPEEAKEQKRKLLAERWERLKQLMDPGEMEKYRTAFRLFDTDGSGSVNVDEVDGMLRSMGITVPKDQISVLIDQVDLDGSGEVDEQEFIMMMASAETSPEWQSIRKRVSDLSREKVDPKKSIGNRLKELEAFIHQAEAKFRKAKLQEERIGEVEAKLDGAVALQTTRIDRLDQDLDTISDKFGSVDKAHKSFEAELARKEGVDRALKTIGRLALLEEQIKTKLERSDMEEVKAMIWTDVSGLLEEATKDAVQRPEFEERLRTKADVVKLGMKADQDLVDAVVERIEQRVETMYGDVELIKMNEEAEELHREQQRRKEQEIVDLMSVLDDRVKLTSENVEEDLTQVQKALAGKADRTKVVQILQQLDTMGSNTEVLERIKKRLGSKASKVDFDRVLGLAKRLGKNVKSLDDSMKGLSDVDGVAVKCLACDRPLAKLSESTLLGDGGVDFADEPNPPLGRPKGYLLHPLHRSGALRPLGLHYRVQRVNRGGEHRPRAQTAGGTRRSWGGTVRHGGGRPYSGTPTKARGFAPSRSTRSAGRGGGGMGGSASMPGLSPETHFGSSPNQRGNRSSPGTPVSSTSTVTRASPNNSFSKMDSLKRYVQGCDGRYYVTDSL
jgi:hypothetical protein